MLRMKELLERGPTRCVHLFQLWNELILLCDREIAKVVMQVRTFTFRWTYGDRV